MSESACPELKKAISFAEVVREVIRQEYERIFGKEEEE